LPRLVAVLNESCASQPAAPKDACGVVERCLWSCRALSALSCARTCVLLTRTFLLGIATAYSFDGQSCHSVGSISNTLSCALYYERARASILADMHPDIFTTTIDTSPTLCGRVVSHASRPHLLRQVAVHAPQFPRIQPAGAPFDPLLAAWASLP